MLYRKYGKLRGTAKAVRIMGIAVAIAFFTLAGQCAFAETPPVATHEVSGPEMVPVRVWVFPGTYDGISVSGHYEYFELMLDIGNKKVVPDGLEAVPIINNDSPETIEGQPAAVNQAY